MVFNSFEDLKAAVAERRKDTLTLEVDLGSGYSVEYEDARKELAEAKAMSQVAGGFLGGGNLEELEAKVAALKPEPRNVWVRFRKLDLGAWALLIKQGNLTQIEQYEKVLVDTFVGVWGVDPVENEEAQPLSTDASLLSSKSPNAILPGGALHQVVQSFMHWQNSGGDVTIRPTKSGRV